MAMIKKAQSDAATITAPTTVKTKRQAAAASSDDDFENKAPAKKKIGESDAASASAGSTQSAGVLPRRL